MKYDVIVGVDPGISGGVAVWANGHMQVWPTPTKKSKTGRQEYDLKAMAELLNPYKGLPRQKTLFVLELVHAMPGQGVSSVFHFGRGRGIWEGMAVGLRCELTLVSPQAWKKQFDGLIVHRLSKEQKPKTANEKKEAAKQKRLAKALAKEKARELAGTLYPDLKDKFVKVNSDGLAEAVLIAHYANLHIEELTNEK